VVETPEAEYMGIRSTSVSEIFFEKKKLLVVSLK
jgi:hypothetical protein